MATDATGPATSPDSIPTYATSGDAPSGKGFNAAMAAIQTALSARWIKSLFTTTGDIAYASAASTPARLGIGSTGNILTVAGGLPVWAAPASSGAMTQIFDVVVARGNAGDPATGATVIDSNTILGGVLPTSYKHLVFEIANRSQQAAAFGDLWARFNNDSGGNYQHQFMSANANVGAGSAEGFGSQGAYAGICPGASATADLWGTTTLKILDYQNARKKGMRWDSGGVSGTSSGTMFYRNGASWWLSASAITRIQIYSTGFTAAHSDGSRFTLYGLN